MTKRELLERDIPHKKVLDIYKDDEQIPRELVDILCTPPEQQPIVIHTSEDGLIWWNTLLEDYLTKHT